MMTPAQHAAGVESCAGFGSDLAAHFEPGGLVVSTPQFFVMARPVRRDADADDLLNPWMRWPEPDAWMIWLAAGDLPAALALLWPLYGDGKKWIAFQTDGPARWVSITRLQSLLKHYGKRRRQQRQGAQASEAESARLP